MSDPLDDELRRSLHSRADQLPRRPDLSRAAITQAKGIRRRRRVAGAVAAAALVAVAVPVGLEVGDAMSGSPEPAAPPAPTGPAKVNLDLRDLPQGDPPEVPYVDGTTFVDGDDRIELSGRTDGIAPVDGGVLVTSNETWQLTFYADDGSSQDLGPVRTAPVASADGEWAAWATNEGGSPALVLRDATGEESMIGLATADPYSVDILAIVDGTAYFTYIQRNGRRAPLSAWSSTDPAPELVEDIDATAVSRDGNLIGLLEIVDDFRHCATIVDRSTGDETEERCGNYFSIKGFSPDGRYALADNAEGFGASQLTVLDTETGEVIRRYGSATKRQITFMNTVFEDDDTLLIQADESQQATALLRCDITTGDCELAAPLVDGSADSPGGPPYLLPDVR